MAVRYGVGEGVEPVRLRYTPLSPLSVYHLVYYQIYSVCPATGKLTRGSRTNSLIIVYSVPYPPI